MEPSDSESEILLIKFLESAQIIRTPNDESENRFKIMKLIEQLIDDGTGSFGHNLDQDTRNELEAIRDDAVKAVDNCERLCEMNPAKADRYKTQLRTAKESLERQIEELLGYGE